MSKRTQMQVGMNDEEREIIKNAAKRDGVSVAAYLRGAALKQAREADHG